METLLLGTGAPATTHSPLGGPALAGPGVGLETLLLRSRVLHQRTRHLILLFSAAYARHALTITLRDAR